MVTLRLNKPNFKATMEALKMCAYDTRMPYKDRLPYLNAYLDIEYAMKLQRRKESKK